MRDFASFLSLTVFGVMLLETSWHLIFSANKIKLSSFDSLFSGVMMENEVSLVSGICRWIYQDSGQVLKSFDGVVKGDSLSCENSLNQF